MGQKVIIDTARPAPHTCRSPRIDRIVFYQRVLNFHSHIIASLSTTLSSGPVTRLALVVKNLKRFEKA